MSDEWFSDLMKASDDRSRHIGAEVWRLREEKATPLFEYRCQKRSLGSCLLAAVYVIDGAHVAYLPRYALPKSINDNLSSPGGRAMNTEDGGNRWKERTVDLDPLANWGGASSGAPGHVGSLTLSVQWSPLLGRYRPRGDDR